MLWGLLGGLFVVVGIFLVLFLGFLVGSSDYVKFLPFYLLGSDICTHSRIILYQ